MKAVHWSTLRNMAKSPAHYKYALDNPPPITPAMRFGSLVHAMVLGRPRSFVVYDKARRGNAWKDFKEAHADLEIVTADEWDRATACADAVKTDPLAWPLIVAGDRERAFGWKVNHRECAGTPDVVGDALVDLKVTGDANPDRFHWHAQKMNWPAQLAWYLDGLEQQGRVIGRVSIIAVESKPPHVVTVFDLTDAALDLGRRTWRGLFERLMVCEESDTWPGYSQCPVPLDSSEDLELIIDGEEIVV